MKTQQLYICEKPSQARDIAKILGCTDKEDGYIAKVLNNKITTVTWCFGHLLEMAEPNYYCKNINPWAMETLPIVPNHWNMIIKKESKKQFNIIKQLLNETDSVVIATDADREGEVIAREILTYCNFKGDIKRLWLSALDDDSIIKALNEIRCGKSTENLYHAGLARQRADWLIGMNMTIAATVSLNQHNTGVLSVGRVQTPTLKLIVDRENAIKEFKPQEYFELIGEFTTNKNNKNVLFFAKWQPREDIPDDDTGHCFNQKKVRLIAQKVKDKACTINKFTETNKKQHAPLCFSLSTLQKFASSQLGLSAKETLDTLQSLYETLKAITYPRTDCGYLPTSQFKDAKVVLHHLSLVDPRLAELISHIDINHQSMVWNDSKITAHHGLIPTFNTNVRLSVMTGNERNLYNFIARNYIAQFLGDFEYTERAVEIICEGEIFKATSLTPLKPGWKRILKNSNMLHDENSIENNDEYISILPRLTLNENVKLTGQKFLTKSTKPPARYTEGTLIDAMKSIGKNIIDNTLKKILKETAGIGTEATRANIIETLYKRRFIEKQKNQLYATPKGCSLISQMPPIVSDPQLTAQWEQELENIASGQAQLDKFIYNQKKLLEEMLSSISNNRTQIESPKALSMPQITFQCIKCKNPLVFRHNPKTKQPFWGCSQYPKCHTSYKVKKDGNPELLIFINKNAKNTNNVEKTL